MKQVTALLIVLFAGLIAHAQMISVAVDILTVYSQNARFYLRSIPYDNESPSLRGKTSVYKVGNSTPLYTLDRGFDVVEPNTLFLSNDGEVIFSANTWEPDENTDGLKSISIYKHGKLIRSLTQTEVTGCDPKRERCRLTYYNEQASIDKKDLFLKRFAIFSFDDFVYLTDSRKQVHTFDLKEARLIKSEPFNDAFEQLKLKARLTRVNQVTYNAPLFENFPKLRNGSNANASLAAYIGMKAGGLNERLQFKLYTVVVTGNLLRDGSLEMEKIEVDKELPKEKIEEFFRLNRFDTRQVPAVFAKWNLRDQFFYFRNKDDRQARLERQQQVREDRQEFERRLTLDTINGVYIPANLLECLVELDKQLSEIDKQEMQALPKREDMIRYHHSLGMWMRNTWGLWGGSRLQKYFTDRKISHPDEMSSVVLYHYHDWLNGKKDTWKTWESSTQKSQ